MELGEQLVYRTRRLNPFLRGMITAALSFVVSLITSNLAAQSIRLAVPTSPRHRLDLVERLVVGDTVGPLALVFAREAMRDAHGRLLVGDANAGRLFVYDSIGHLTDTLVPGLPDAEAIQSPWAFAQDPHDSLFVFDLGLQRMIVFDSALHAIRSFKMSPAWNVVGFDFLPSGNLVVAAFGFGESHVLHEVTRDGDVLRSFGYNPDSAGAFGYQFPGSLLGGDVALTKDRIAYSNKSPYEILFTSTDSTKRGKFPVCLGDTSWTTPPSEIVDVKPTSQTLSWTNFRHSARIISLGNHKYLNVLLDLPHKRTVLDVIDDSCKLLLRKIVTPTTVFTHASGSWLVGVRVTEVSRVVLYQFQLVDESSR